MCGHWANRRQRRHHQRRRLGAARPHSAGCHHSLRGRRPWGAKGTVRRLTLLPRAPRRTPLGGLELEGLIKPSRPEGRPRHCCLRGRRDSRTRARPGGGRDRFRVDRPSDTHRARRRRPGSQSRMVGARAGSGRTARSGRAGRQRPRSTGRGRGEGGSAVPGGPEPAGPEDGAGCRGEGTSGAGYGRGGG
jgi:hypothetical protein